MYVFLQVENDAASVRVGPGPLLHEARPRSACRPPREDEGTLEDGGGRCRLWLLAQSRVGVRGGGERSPGEQVGVRRWATTRAPPAGISRS